ncbi:esterase, PHB depolymerase family [Methylobacterium sp. UNC378MF]|jgi:poly(hydroxyalkanoate) depolymerase family esterase|uniref:extracellular catalytic domain type 1 short-chain-length polyhydroxyalkanoate depolymerase n=1 Tax=Methylobacterium sp. UNC378MF TaxID=1502748 RepID=UPI000888096A|nr:PHB depolymerase family esterase [Methylobacterium sp. UNC378MF]SDA24559.1 esterase, PHB depolymerase family [Methylobacterium sp. UNC378MF]
MTEEFGSRDGERDDKTGPWPFADMIEATRLTGLGRLEEATALIHRSLGGPRAAPAAQTAAPPQIAANRDDAAAEARNSAAETGTRMREVVGQVVRGLAPVLKGLGNPLRPTPPPAGRAGGTGRFVSLAHAEPAGTREYKLFIPGHPDRAAPLIVMLHGCTQNPDDFAAGTGMNTLAERAGVFVAYPAQSRHAHAQRCWNWYEPRDQGRGAGEPAIIAGLTRAILAEHPIDPARVYIAGLSAGGAAALNIARAYPDLYAAVGVHSGLAAGCARDLGSALMAMQVGAPGLGTPTAFGGPAPAARVPTIIFHGEDDGTVSVRNADQVLSQAKVAGLTARSETFEGRGHPFTRTRYRDEAGRVVVEDWRVRGAGHAWSGGRSDGSYTDPEGPDASRAMLDFFAEHRLGPARRP